MECSPREDTPGAVWSMLYREDFPLLRIQFFVAGLLTLCMAAGCKAQTPSADPGLNRHIDVLVRSQFNIPQDYELTLGDRKPSQIPGYDTLPITLTRGSQKSQIDFLISKDNKTLARLETFNLEQDPAFSIDVSGRAVRGNPNAKVTVVNFDDLECPYCARMHQALFPATLDRYKNTVRFVYKDYPLSFHPWAMHAAVDANCLAAQSGDVYWAYVDYLHAHGQEVNGEDRSTAKSFDALDRIARQEATLGKLDGDKLDACIAKQDEASIRASMAEGTKLGVDGTPALFIDGERVTGAVPEEQLWHAIDRALRAQGIEPPPSEPAKQPATAQAGKGN